MESEIARRYLESDYRAALLTSKLDRYSPKNVSIYLEKALIRGGTARDDETIIKFLEKLGDVKVSVRRDDAKGLQFAYGTFDSWMSEDDFLKACREYDEEIDYLANYYYFVDGKITDRTHVKDGMLLIKFHPLNTLFRVKDGPVFSPFSIDVTNDHRGEFLKKLRKIKKIRGNGRVTVDYEYPLYISHSPSLNYVRIDVDRKEKPYVINLNSNDHTIYIEEPRKKEWMTRKEALTYLKDQAKTREYVHAGRRFYKSDKVMNLKISDIGEGGIVNSMNTIILQNIEPYDIFSISLMSFSYPSSMGFARLEDAIYRSRP